MNDDQLDALVWAAGPISDSVASSLDLRGAEAELLEEIMATTPTTDLGGIGPTHPKPRRRRRARLAVGVAAVAVAAGLVGVGLVLVDESPDDGTVQTQEDAATTTTTADVPSAPPPPPVDCDADYDNLEPSVQLPTSEVPDSLRVLPTWTPDGVEITSAGGLLDTLLCPSSAPYPADSALELGSAVDPEAEIILDGPLPERAAWGVAQTQTALRGVPATRMDPTYLDNDVAFAWTEPDGWSWTLWGYSVDDATLVAVAEALVLDSSPEGEEPVATLPPEALPAGFEIRWQVSGTPVPLEPVMTSWSVMVGTSQAVQTGTICHLRVTLDRSEQPLMGSAGSQIVTINGQDALWTNRFGGGAPTALGSALIWKIAPDALAEADCSSWDSSGGHGLPLETMIQFAESVVRVAADDPRIPPGS